MLLITGGSRGIGAAIAAQAVTEGYAVCFTYSSDRDRAEQTAATLRHGGGDVAVLRTDVAEPDAAAGVFEQAEALLGPVTALVNNAGVTGRLGPFPQTSLSDMRRVLDVNVLGGLVTTQQAVRMWLDRGVPGAVVNVSSVAASTGAPHEYVVYAASKAAIEAMTVGLAKEVAAYGIRVNAVAPGTVFTDIHAAAGEPDRPARVVERVPMGRIGEPAEIAAAVMWLLSEEASYVTGAILRVSGGA